MAQVSRFQLSLCMYTYYMNCMLIYLFFIIQGGDFSNANGIASLSEIYPAFEATIFFFNFFLSWLKFRDNLIGLQEPVVKVSMEGSLLVSFSEYTLLTTKLIIFWITEAFIGLQMRISSWHMMNLVSSLWQTVVQIQTELSSSYSSSDSLILMGMALCL